MKRDLSLIPQNVVYRILGLFLDHTMSEASATKILIRLIETRRKLLSYFGIDTMRSVEYSFIFKGINTRTGVTILDVGCCDSLLPYKLAKIGFDVYAIDIRPYYERHPNLQFIRADVRFTPFRANSFDRITIVSVIEHIGYGSSSYIFGDFLAIKELHSILKRNGELLLTTHFARKFQHDSPLLVGGRIYDKRRINLLMSNFLVKKMEYYIPINFSPINKRKWVKATEKEAESDFHAHPFAIILLLARKVNGCALK